MNRLRHIPKGFALFMALVVAATSFPLGAARAAMVQTEQAIEQNAAAEQRARVLDFMTREEVRRQMIELGIDPDEATERAAGLSDGEIQQIAGHLDRLPAGEGVEVVLAAILLVLLILLITDLLGLTDVFPFVRSQR